MQAVNEVPRVSLLDLEGLGKEVWIKALAGKDAVMHHLSHE